MKCQISLHHWFFAFREDFVVSLQEKGVKTILYFNFCTLDLMTDSPYYVAKSVRKF